MQVYNQFCVQAGAVILCDAGSSAAEAATTAAQWAVHDEMDALKFWRLAGRALLKDDSLQQFQQVMETHVVPKLTALGRMQEAAKALQQVGECLLSGGQVDAACAAFERAISLFEADDLGGRGAQVCREQIAQAAIDRQQWKLASTQYAAMHAKDMDHPILKRMGTPKALRSGMSHGRFFPSVRLFFFHCS